MDTLKTQYRSSLFWDLCGIWLIWAYFDLKKKERLPTTAIQNGGNTGDNGPPTLESQLGRLTWRLCMIMRIDCGIQSLVWELCGITPIDETPLWFLLRYSNVHSTSQSRIKNASRELLCNVSV